MHKTQKVNAIGSAEAARILHIDRSTLTRWAAARKIIPIFTADGDTGAMFFDPADVAALLALTAPVDSTSPQVESTGVSSVSGGA
ncbi:hypothetical protein [Cryobacterium fucosi]|uniref:DNA-binding protein n=1 Tax=Cryobacterium fucosi TaxID=1259157 RepID=A0A4R9BGE1_9MICO|nr:hypothetical protein [Cryobacterium fucosi]TFD83954.1 hypothetical protein E3T48_00045 [Cryobacterium fucosi]